MARKSEAQQKPEPTLRPNCAFDACLVGATIRERAATGRANLCERHAVERHRQRSAQRNAERGIHTAEDAKAFVRKMYAEIGRNEPSKQWAHDILAAHAADVPLYVGAPRITRHQLDSARRAIG